MSLANVVRRILPALLMASSVTLLAAGVFNWAPPQTIGEQAFATPTDDSGDPSLHITPAPSRSAQPTVSPLPSTTFVAPSGSYPIPASPTARSSPSAPRDPGTVPTTTGDALPTRIVIPSLNIDLPVIEGNTDYPLCDVAQYLDGFANPGQPGTTYLYGHARQGMFLPLLLQSQINDGAGMIGALVKLYTADSKLHLYQINVVKRHALDLSLAYDLGPGEHQLIMQTSEGPHGTVPKLQVSAKPTGIFEATDAESHPTARPRACA